MPYIIQDRNTFFYLATDGWCASPHSHRIRSFDTEEEAETAQPDDCSILPFRTRAPVAGLCYLYHLNRPYTKRGEFRVTSADHLVVFADETAARAKADELGLNQDEVTVKPQVIIPSHIDLTPPTTRMQRHT